MSDSELRVFPCEQCPAEFLTGDDLFVHEGIHNGLWETCEGYSDAVLDDDGMPAPAETDRDT